LNQFENPNELAEQIEYLLEDDRFLCPVENYEVRTESPKAPTRAPKLSLKLKKKQDCNLRFFAPVLVQTMFIKHFEGPKARGKKYKDVWIPSINGPFVCLTATILRHLLGCYRSGEYLKPADFNTTNIAVQSE
jgi:hypothetical protein